MVPSVPRVGGLLCRLIVFDVADFKVATADPKDAVDHVDLALVDNADDCILPLVELEFDLRRWSRRNLLVRRELHNSRQLKKFRIELHYAELYAASASWKNFLSISHPTYRRPCFLQAMPTVPDPQNGSKTVSPGFEYMSTSFSIKESGLANG